MSKSRLNTSSRPTRSKLHRVSTLNLLRLYQNPERKKDKRKIKMVLLSRGVHAEKHLFRLSLEGRHL